MPLSSVLPGHDLPQIVPSELCLTCDVCCRFPERESFLRPFFTAEEIEQAVAHGAAPEHFPDPGGGRIRLMPHPHGEGYLCPCFDRVTQHCAIYPVRPLDCRLYPIALMRDREGHDLIMGLDTKCPYVRDSANASRLRDYVERVGREMERPALRDVLAGYPDLIGRFQDDVTPNVNLGPHPAGGS